MDDLERKQREFLQRLPLIQEEAHRLGLYGTGHALHEAVRVSGHELVYLLEKKAKEQSRGK